jgi:hypothetical protein
LVTFGAEARPGCAASFQAMRAGALLASLTLPVAAARADDLPSLLMAAAKLIPATEEGRMRCSAIADLSNQLRIPFSFGDHQTFTEGGAGYARDTVGAYLGDGPKGEPAPPFVQALLDAGAARRVTLRWVVRTTTPTGAIPHLQDTGAPTAPTNDRPLFVTREVAMEGEAFIVTGEDRELFPANTNRYVQSPQPPAIGGGGRTPDAAPGSPAAPPPGVRSTMKVCMVEVADRVLEYGDVRASGSGVRSVSAAILFHPERLPAWASDFRVTGATANVFVPDDVRFVTFRDDGDGWRPTPYPEAYFMQGKTHIVDGE